ncbi:hypothetical protein OG612_45125 (plasmid) [Streptomyces sp. NBC_01527]|uniref:hypothetical protein n=1 Tax=Streptomyces sp. NBC_01527 TaxID=2903894 RepID=UPI002F919DE1
MSTTVPSLDLSKTTPKPHSQRDQLVPMLATLIALIAAVLALMDLIANGLGTTLIHLAFALAVFAAVRLCVGLALNPHRPPLPKDDTESLT